MYLLRFLRKSELQKRSGRYLLYAVGEVVLIVVGIMIALEINNRNETKLDRENERLLLVSLLKEAEANELLIDRLVKSHQTANAAIVKLMDYSAKSEADVPSSEFDRLLADNTSWINPSFNRGAEDTVLVGGKLDLIQSQDLQQKLTDWVRWLDVLLRMEQQYNNFMLNVWIPFLRDHGNLSQIANAQEHTLLGNRTHNTKSPPGEFIDHNEVLSDRTFLNIMQEKKWNHEDLLKVYESMDSILSKLKQGLKTELEN